MTTIYEIYKQDDKEESINKTKRYHTTDKKKAFKFMIDRNIKDEGNFWRVAIRIQDMIIFDVDNNDMDNIKTIIKYYENIFGKMTVWKTNGGYHIHTKKFDDKYGYEFSYNTLRVLYPFLETKDVSKYARLVKNWYDRKLKEEFNEKWTKQQYLENLRNTFPDSGLYCGIGDFDIIFALNVVLKGYYCIRISKKSENDKPVKMIL